MVLGFGTKKKKPVEEPVVRPSPSLPQLKEQRIPWPENLVDINQVYATDYPSPPIDRPPGSAKVSFQSTRGPIPFHRPFRESTDHKPSPVSALFGTGVPPPPTSFNGVGPRNRTATHPRTVQRRAKYAPNFNVMVVGAKKTGKTSFIRLLLGTSNISPTNSAEQLATLASYRSTNVGPTTAISTACIEILQSAPNRIPTIDDRIALTCIDTPGLDFSESKEFAMERTFSDILKYLDTQFAETMGEESKVVRTSKGDQHVHLCIYLIDPDSVMTPAARQARSRWAAAGLNPLKLGEGISEYDSGSDDEDEPEEGGDDESAGDNGEDQSQTEGEGNGHGHGLDHTKEESDQGKDSDNDSTDDYGEPENPPIPTTIGEDKTPRASISRESHIPSPPASPPQSAKSHRQKQPSVTSSSHNSKEKVEFPTVAGGDKNRLVMSPVEVRLISRLCKRVNVLPVISRADTLTDNRLNRVKQAIRRDLQAADGAGIWGIWDAEPGTVPGRMISISSNNNNNSANQNSSNSNNNHHITPSSPVPSSSNGNAGGTGAGDVSVVAGGGNDDRPSRPVIKLRGPKRGLTRSRSRKSLKSAVDAEFEEPDIEASPGYPIAPITIPNIYNHNHRSNNIISNNNNKNDNVAPEEAASNMSNSRRTSAVSAKTDAAGPYGAIFSRADLRARMPFAIIAPEKERPLKQQQQHQQQGNGNGNGNGNGSVSENGEYHVPNVYGRFVRKFRWGTIDVLDPQHCDFAALRAAVLHSYMKSLKATTKDVLYERFRTEKLLARRATANISEEERKRMIQDLGL